MPTYDRVLIATGVITLGAVAAGFVYWAHLARRAEELLATPDAAAAVATMGELRPSALADPAEAEAEMETEPDLPEQVRVLLADAPNVERDAQLAELLQELVDSDEVEAGEFLRLLSHAERTQILGALLTDAARHPGRAIDLAQRVFRIDPEHVRSHGHLLVDALARAGEYRAAVHFITNRSSVGGESETPAEWLKRTFATWAVQAPVEAVDFSQTLPAEAMREEALRAAATVWSDQDPQSAAQYFATLIDGPTRRIGLDTVLRGWLVSDREAANRWLETVGPTLGAPITLPEGL